MTRPGNLADMRQREAQRERVAAMQCKDRATILADWASNRAYIDGAGNYRLRRLGKRSGPVAWWNRLAKAWWPDVTALHAEAQQGQP